MAKLDPYRAGSELDMLVEIDASLVVPPLRVTAIRELQAEVKRLRVVVEAARRPMYGHTNGVFYCRICDGGLHEHERECELAALDAQHEGRP